VRLSQAPFTGEMTLQKTEFRITTLAMIVLMVACQDHNQSATGPAATGTSSSSANPTTAPAAVNVSTQKWLGKWNGPEGTYLFLSRSNGKYVVKSSLSMAWKPMKEYPPETASNSRATAKQNPSTRATAKRPE
jgi:hypothetical protein